MMFISLERADTGKAIWINMDHIRSFQRSAIMQPQGTVIYFENGDELSVTNPVTDITNYIRELKLQ